MIELAPLVKQENLTYEPTGLAKTIFDERYTLYQGETWDDASWRLANHVAKAESEKVRQGIAEEFHDIISKNLFMPGGRIWYGAGRNRAQMLNCISGDTLVHTQSGLKEARELSGKEVSILTEDGYYRLARWYSYGVQPLYEVVLSNGDSLFATEGHEWVITNNGPSNKRVKTRDLVGQTIPMKSPRVFNYVEEDWKIGVQHGLVFGDGNKYKVESKFKGTQEFSLLHQFADSKHLVEDHFEKYTETKHGTKTALSVTHLPAEFKSLPQGNESPSYIRGFIGGLISADGCVDSRGHFMLHNKSETVLINIRRLATSVGILSTSIRMTREKNPWTGEYAPVYKLSFVKASAYNDGKVDEKLILKNKHREYLKNSPLPLKRQTMRVEAVLSTDRVEEVFCCVEPETHTMVIGPGYVTGQCFVIPSSDSREGWGKVVSDVIVISGMGGGVGINLSPIRPRGSKILGTGGIATGAVSLMQMINNVGDIIVGGGGRRMALMLDLDIDHPDLEEFLDKKLDRKELNNANVSVVINSDTAEFVQKVRNGKDYDLRYNNKIHGKVNAKEVWDRIVLNAYNSGEPGVLNGFLANKENNIAYYKSLVSTNPCGEIWLEEYGCCDLGALVLPRFVDSFGNFDFSLFRLAISTAVRFLDNVLTVNEYPLPEIKENCLNVRRIGLGIMGLHSMLIKMGMSYSSREAIDFIDQLMSFLKEEAYESSIDLAIEKGPFSAYQSDFLESGFIKRAIPSYLQDRIIRHGIRNCALLTIAPTGTTGMVSDVSTGIEPIFAPAYWRRFYRPTSDGSRQLDKELVVDPLWDKLEREGKDLSVLEGAYDIKPERHFEIQRICQRHIDNATSKTINLSSDYPIDSLSDLWLEYLPDLKGTTFYRAGSRGQEPLEAIPLDEARALLASRHVAHQQGTVAEQNSMDCPDGVCEIPDELKPHIGEYIQVPEINLV